MKVSIIILSLLLFVIMVPLLSEVYSLDPPHLVNCIDCHTTHVAPGGTLTSYASNENLCLSCHNSGGLASGKPFHTNMQAIPGISGTSHKWTGTMPQTSSPSNLYGLRAIQDLSSEVLKQRLNNFGGVVTCSVCHDQHSQARQPWDPNAPAYGGAGTGSGRHFMRIDNEMNQLCEDCHYYKVMNHTRVEGDDPNYPPNGVNVFSHPVGQSLNENQKNYDRPMPLDANGVPQSGTRSEVDNDNNPSNNLILDNTQRVRCLTCHRVHYSDSNSLTIDGP